jgi:hypothetical protein
MDIAAPFSRRRSVSLADAAALTPLAGRVEDALG